MRSRQHQSVAPTRIISGRRALLRATASVVALTLCIFVVAIADDALAPVKRATNIPAQSLGAALQELAKERGFQIVYVSEDVNSLRTAGAVGDLTPTEALQKLLEGTGLTFRSLNDKTVVIVTKPAVRPQVPP
jgi:iron complex outermembrane recepter protein